jgi:hypothetical protein
MDPYLENPALWPGLHNWLIAALADSISADLPSQYFVALEERVHIASAPPSGPSGIPDLAVIASDRGGYSNGTSGGHAAEAPGGGVQVLTATVPVPEQIRETYLEVRDLPSGDVVTALEVLSPWNKRPGEGRRVYEEKRARTLGTATHLVEIDLLRGGMPPLIYVPGASGDGALPGDYRVLVARAGQRPDATLYAFSIRDPIPRFPVPLRPGDQDVSVNLQSVMHSLYDRARFALRIDYRADPVPPLRPQEAEWADALLRRHGLR